MRLVRQLQSQLGLTVVLVTRDLDTLAALATRIAVLAEQRILACEPLERILAVDHPFVERFFGSASSRRALLRGKETH